MVATRTLDDLLGRSLFNGVRGTVILRTKIFKSISIQVDLAFFLSRYWGGGLNNAIVYIYIYKYPLQKCGEPRDTPNRHLTLSVIFFIVRKNMTSGACELHVGAIHGALQNKLHVLEFFFIFGNASS